DIDHSKAIVDGFVRAGIVAEHLDGTDTNERRQAVMARLRSGETQVVSNCALFGEGVDIPDLDLVIAARPCLITRATRSNTAGRWISCRGRWKEKSSSHG